MKLRVPVFTAVLTLLVSPAPSMADEKHVAIDDGEWLADVIGNRLRDRIGAVAADALSTDIAAITSAVSAASRDTALQLGADMAKPRLSDQKSL